MLSSVGLPSMSSRACCSCFWCQDGERSLAELARIVTLIGMLLLSVT
jgi:hypothetical protein